MDIFSIVKLLGGLAFFLYGIAIMSTGLEKIAGGKLEKILKKMTDGRVKGFILGTGITAVIQSSSAITVMLVGLVNSGIMKLGQTIPVIMGSNVGTSATAWLLSLTGIDDSSNLLLSFLQPKNFTPILALIGVIMIMVAKSNKNKSIGSVMIGFAILMAGMGVMSDAMKPLQDVPEFQQLLIAFDNPFLGIVAGAIVTAIIQSSSASVGILQALSLASGISYAVAIPIILGQNIGTCISAVLASIGVNTSAKRVACVHFLFNVIGIAVLYPIFCLINKTVHLDFMTQNISPAGIAIVHSVFNVTASLMFLPFVKLLESFAMKIIKDKQGKDKNVILDERLLLTPAFAVGECYAQTVKMGEMVESNFINSTKMLKSFHQKKADHIKENEAVIDEYEDVINNFLLKLSGKGLAGNDNNRLSQLFLAVGDFERIGDHTAHILKIAEKIKESEKKLSSTAIEELKTIVNAVSEIYAISFDAYKNDDINLAHEVEPLEAVIKKLIRKVKARHIDRLKEGACTTEISFMFVELLTVLRRIAAHCGNIAMTVIQYNDSSIGKHEYNHRNKDEDVEFISKYQDYKSRYSVSKS